MPLPERPAPLEVGMQGELDLFGFIVTVNFPSTKVMDPEPPSEGQDLSHAFALTHECIHFLQTCSCGFLYRTAHRLFTHVIEVGRQIQKLPCGQPIRLPITPKSEIAAIFEELNAPANFLEIPEIKSLCALDIVEGATVFIQSRINHKNVTHDSYLQLLDDKYGKDNSAYTNAYRLGDWYLGKDLFEIFSPLCFLALCTLYPAANFLRMIQILGRSGMFHRVKTISTRELGAVFNQAGLEPFVVAAQEANRLGPHPILHPYLHLLHQEKKDLDVIEFAGRPYAHGDSDIFNVLLPPLTRYSDGVGIAAPHLLNFGNLTTREANTDFVIRLTALCGAVTAMEIPRQYYMQCPHTGCPHYPLQLCHSFVPIPKAFSDCGFVDSFEKFFKKPLNSFTFS